MKMKFRSETLFGKFQKQKFGYWQKQRIEINKTIAVTFKATKIANRNRFYVLLKQF